MSSTFEMSTEAAVRGQTAATPQVTKKNRQQLKPLHLKQTMLQGPSEKRNKFSFSIKLSPRASVWREINDKGAADQSLGASTDAPRHLLMPGVCREKTTACSKREATQVQLLLVPNAPHWIKPTLSSMSASNAIFPHTRIYHNFTQLTIFVA